LGGLDPQKAAEQIENNNVWDLIDSGATDEEIIAEMNDMSISTNSRFKFDEKKLAKIRKKGRVELEVGQKGRNTSRLSLQQLDEENKNRGIAGNDDDVSLDDLGEALAPDDIISGSGVEAEGAAVVAGAEDEVFSRLQVANRQKLRMAQKIKEALSASYEILEMREERRSTSSGREKIENREIAKELGISEQLVQKHLALIDEIRKRVEDGTFADPEWMIPFDEIADIGRTAEGIRQLSEKYNFPETLMSLMAGQVSGFKRRLDTRSVGVDKDYQDFADQVNSLIKAGYTRTEIASMIPTVNSLQGLKKRMDVAMEKGLLDKELMSLEVLGAIQAIRKGKIDEVSSGMVEKLLSLGVNIDNLTQVQSVKLSPEDIEFASLRSSGKSKREVMELMNISEEQYQRIFSRMSAREKKK
jgi:DNA-binding CsgD family transcriptional regulator